ncbi:MAG: hypothetical protein KAH23_05985 [Kiritimatiellae bacterium]|nr:hypothetical protein [Kiritimatiellia bacterium]
MFKSIIILLCWTRLCSVLTADIHYVVPANPAAQHPYTNMVSAATNIQNAVNAADANDTVLVSSGIYSLTTQVTINKGILLTTEDGAGKTVITAQNSGRCVYLAHENAILDGFTVTGGNANNGGGIYINANGTIRNCIVTSNSADWGGGIYCNSNGVINRCVISHNTASTQGGGVNFFIGGEMSDCFVAHNTANTLFGGGVVLREGGTVNNCTIVSNSAAIRGGGIFSATSGTVNNSIVWANNSDFNPEWYASPVGLLFFSSCTTPEPPGSNNVTGNPLFFDPANNDYRLTEGSSCIDIGSVGNPAALDLLDTPRPLDGDANGSVVADAGAYEFIHPDADTDNDSMPDAWELIYSIDPLTNNASDDDDDDNRSNLDEYIADTNPTNAMDYLQIDIGSNTNTHGTIVVCWRSSNNRLYTLRHNTNLLLINLWTNITGLSSTNGTGNIMSFTNTLATHPEFYRIKASLKP